MVTLSSNLFSKLPAGLSCLLLKAAQPRYVKSGELLFAAGDAGDGCYLIEQGLLKVVVTSRRGEERIIAILGAGAIVGELSILDGLPRSASVFALGECVLRFVSREAFQRCADEHPEMYQALVVILAARLRQVDDAFAASVFMTVKARVARAFIELVEYIGEPFSEGHIVLCERISNGNLAAMAGVARENVSRVLSLWRRRKLVTGSPRHYCINNIAALRREMVSDCELVARRKSGGQGRTDRRAVTPASAAESAAEWRETADFEA